MLKGHSGNFRVMFRVMFFRRVVVGSRYYQRQHKNGDRSFAWLIFDGVTSHLDLSQILKRALGHRGNVREPFVMRCVCTGFEHGEIQLRSFPTNCNQSYEMETAKL